MIGNYGRAAGERVFLRWATLGEQRQPRTWPRLEMGKVLTAVSSTGQKPKSRVSGTTAAADGKKAGDEPVLAQRQTRSAAAAAAVDSDESAAAPQDR